MITWYDTQTYPPPSPCGLAVETGHTESSHFESNVCRFNLFDLLFQSYFHPKISHLTGPPQSISNVHNAIAVSCLCFGVIRGFLSTIYEIIS